MICFPRGHRPEQHKGPNSRKRPSLRCDGRQSGEAGSGNRGKGRSMRAFRQNPPRALPPSRLGQGPIGPAPHAAAGPHAGRGRREIGVTTPRHHAAAARGGGARTSGSDADRRTTPPNSSSGRGGEVQRRSANRPMTAARRLVGRRSIRTAPPFTYLA